MALSSKQKKQGIAAGAALGAVTLGGVALSTLGSTSTPGAKPAAETAAPAPRAATADTSSSSGTPSGSDSDSSTPLKITAKADNPKPDDHTVFTVSGLVTGARPGTEIRLQRQSSHGSAWTTLAYTTYTDKNNS